MGKFVSNLCRDSPQRHNNGRNNCYYTHTCNNNVLLPGLESKNNGEKGEKVTQFVSFIKKFLCESEKGYLIGWQSCEICQIPQAKFSNFLTPPKTRSAILSSIKKSIKRLWGQWKKRKPKCHFFFFFFFTIPTWYRWDHRHHLLVLF